MLSQAKMLCLVSGFFFWVGGFGIVFVVVVVCSWGEGRERRLFVCVGHYILNQHQRRLYAPGFMDSCDNHVSVIIYPTC